MTKEKTEVVDLQKLEAERAEKISAIESDSKSIAKKAEKIVVTNEKQEQEAINFLAEIKGRYKRIEEVRLYLTRPLNDLVKKYNNQFKAQSGLYLEIEQKVKRALSVFAMKREEEARKKREEEIKKAEEEIEKARKEAEKNGMPEPINQEIVPETIDPEKTIRTDEAKATYKTEMKARIIDVNKLPIKYRKQILALAVEKGLADRVIREALKEGVREIEGVEIWEEKNVAIG